MKPGNIYTAFYKSGKFLITTKDPKKINAIANQVLELLCGVGLNLKIVKTEIHNIVVQTKISLNGPLDSIFVNLDPRKASFEPEQFPGLVYKDWGVSFLLFSSGSCMIAGLKDVKDAGEMVERFREVIGAR